MALLLLLTLGCNKPGRDWDSFTCDMESLEKEGDATFFKADGQRLAHGETQTDSAARSGKYSSRAQAGKEFGLTWETSDLRPGDQIVAKVWRKSPDNAGTFIADASWGQYKEAVATGVVEGDWVEYILKVHVPTYSGKATLKVYVWNPNPAPAYFDDFSVQRLAEGQSLPEGNVPAQDSIVTLDLEVGSGWDTLERQRDAALNRGLLLAEDQSWVRCTLKEGGKQHPGRLRLKGDWTDHLMGDKWSFRISLDEGEAWRGMTVFSVQNPRTRSYLSEWIFHRWLDKEQVINPLYGFVQVRVNGKDKGLYAYEEHFTPQMARNKGRVKGPIMKYDEEGLWEAQGVSLETDLADFERHVPAYKSSDIVPFGGKSLRKDSTLRREVETAQQLIQQYKTGQRTVWELFDAQKVARYYAVIDVLGAQHAFIWHNQRWYFNPALQKLEPIGFDGFTEAGPLIWIDKPFIGFSRNVRYMAPGYRELMFERFFHDMKFLALYVKALKEFTQPDYLDAFYLSIAPQVGYYEQVIQQEWPGYKFDRRRMFERAETIRQLIAPLQHSSVKAHYQGKTAQGHHYKVFNYHCLPVFLEGIGKKDDGIDETFTGTTFLDAYNNEFPAEYMDVYSPVEGKWIYFKVPGLDSLYRVEVLQWKQPEGITPEQSLFTGLTLQSNDIYQVDEALHRVTFKRGRHTVNRDLLFPAGYQVWFEKGVELDLVNGAKFISKSQVLMFGDSDAPILVTSSDSTAQGFTLLQAEGKSEFHYVAFEGLGSLDYRGWKLDGSVTMYETESLFDHVRIVRSRAEDALCLLRCIFTFNDSYIGQAKEDGLDADFCMGVLNNAAVSRVGKDAMEFSGGNISIARVQIEGAKRRGILAQEEARVTIADGTVTGCETGVSAEDMAKVEVQKLVLGKNERGFTASQTRAEYGPATITVQKCESTGNQLLHVIQTGSRLTLEGKVIEGTVDAPEI